ncbi:MAG: PspA/IM30 family protein [Sphaerochaeta sp.]
MQFFKRIRDIISSNVNTTLDKFEDPQKMIALMITNLEELQTKTRSSIAARKAELVSLNHQHKEAEAAVKRWAERAKLAVTNEKEDLAREALLEKRKASEHASHVGEQITNLEGIIAAQTTQLAQIGDKLKEVKDKQQILIQRSVSAKERRHVASVLKESDSSSLAAKFSDLESKIERMEAEAEMAAYTGATSVLEQFAQMETDEAIEAELAELKKSSAPKKSAPKAE